MPSRTITQVPITAKHIKRIVLEPATIVGDVVTWKLTYDYVPETNFGRPIGNFRTRVYVVSPSVQSVLQTLANVTLALDANVAEGT